MGEPGARRKGAGARPTASGDHLRMRGADLLQLARFARESTAGVRAIKDQALLLAVAVPDFLELVRGRAGAVPPQDADHLAERAHPAVPRAEAPEQRAEHLLEQDFTRPAFQEERRQ